MYLNSNKIIYVAAVGGAGVQKKIDGFCNAALSVGYEVEKALGDRLGGKGLRMIMHQMVSSDARYVMLRGLNRSCVSAFPYLLKAKIQGKVIMIDQPSPAITYIKEIDFQNRSWLNKYVKKLLTYIGCPLAFLLANRVIEYAEESYFFKLFCKRKVLLTGNGIDVSKVPLRTKDYPDGTSHLALVGVAASISAWHGFDRVIRAMEEWRKAGETLKITFDVVGDDKTLHADEMKDYVKKNGLSECVRFLGYQSAAFLNGLYSRESIAVASLGIYRNGLSTASPLKVREYCLAGIPVMSSGYDPDFPEDVPFRFFVSNDDNIDDILKVFKTFAEHRKTFSDEDIRQYAIDHMSFDHKFKEIMAGL